MTSMLSRLSEASALLDVLRSAVQAATLLPVGFDLEPELGGDHHLVAEGRERLPTSSSFVNGP